jgi:hypothetical protein
VDRFLAAIIDPMINEGAVCGWIPMRRFMVRSRGVPADDFLDVADRHPLDE